MQSELSVLVLTALTVSCLHTIAGPDHYLPFIALAKSRGWTVGKTILWTIVCGCGHVGSSVLLGLGGAAVGWSMAKINWLESVRGGIAGWTLLGFGLLYFIYGIVRAVQQRRHKHFDVYDDGSVYVYEHVHNETVSSKERHRVTPWVMFLIFILGPCEPMIPLLYFPAAESSWHNLLVLIITYTICTLITMLLMVLLGHLGFGFFKTAKLERYTHAFGGLAIFICGMGMVFMGW